MRVNVLDSLGNWNPQLFRELKGRLKIRNILLSVGMSLIGQLLVLLAWMREMPTKNYNILEKYCDLRLDFLPYEEQRNQLNSQLSNIQYSLAGTVSENPNSSKYFLTFTDKLPKQEKISILQNKISELNKLLSQNCPSDKINMQLWWQDQWPQIFINLSLAGLFIFLMVGTYMLINDLANEERRGTLNFIRLTPQSAGNIFIGKMLGVPILLYLAGIAAFPFHLWAGLSSKISPLELGGYYAILLASCAFFYSGALLFGLVTSWLSGFQPWLGSGAVGLFLMIVNYKRIEQSPADFMNLFSPSVMFPYLINKTGTDYVNYPFSQGLIKAWEWFYFPLGAAGFSVVILALVNYGLWTYWIGQALHRRFHSEQATLFSKNQSYLLTACFAVESLGFALQSPKPQYSSQYLPNIQALTLWHFCLFLFFIAALLPQRQALQDWGRYKHLNQKTDKGIRLSGWQDLIWGEKSPALVAMAINFLIATVPIAFWVLLWKTKLHIKIEALSGWVLTLGLIAVCASLTQFILMMKVKKRAVWAVGSVAALLILPLFALSALSIKSEVGLWLLTIWPWDALSSANFIRIFAVFAIQLTCFSLLTWQWHKQVKIAGQSTTKSLEAKGK